MKIAFKRGVTPWDWAIRIFSGGPFSHCELCFSDGTFYSAGPLRKVGYRRIKDLSRWDFLELNITYSDEAIIRAWCDSEVGCPYDWLGIVRFIFDFIKPSEKAWFCSEICVAALQKVGLLLDVTPHREHPTSLYELARRINTGS